MLRPLHDDDLAMVLAWRNHPAVRANMYNTHEISLAEHQAWWARTAQDASARYYVFEDDGDPSGVVAFTQISSSNRSASWAFYARENARKGIGTRMEVAALHQAFDQLGLLKLNCEVLSHNLRVVRMHQKFGFRIEGIFRRHHQSGTRRLDVYRLAMFAEDWQRELARQADEIAAQGKPAGTPTVGDRHEEILTLGSMPGSTLLGELARIVATTFPGNDHSLSALHVSCLVATCPDRPIKFSIDVLGVNGRQHTIRAEAYDGVIRLFAAECDTRPRIDAAQPGHVPQGDTP